MGFIIFRIFCIFVDIFCGCFFVYLLISCKDGV
jgi:hypothetical protein